MSFLAVDAQKSLLTLQRNQLQFEQTLVMSEANWVAKCMGEMESSKDGNDQTDTAEYKALEIEDEYLESRQDALDSQIQLIDNEISSLKTMVNNNIKNSCSLNLIGG